MNDRISVKLDQQIVSTPTGASWINMVERWFAELTNKQIRRGVHRSTRALEEAISELSKR